MAQNLINTFIGEAAQLNRSSLNDTPASISPVLLESLIPGYGPIHKFLLLSLGFDVTLLVYLGVVLWLAARAVGSVKALINGLIEAHWVSEISVDSGDEIYTHLKIFLAFMHQKQRSRRLQAETKTISAWEVDSETYEYPGASVNEENIFHNFSNQEAKSPPMFTPGLGRHEIIYKGVKLILKRKEATLFDGLGSGEAPGIVDKEFMSIFCRGRSPKPIKEFLSDAKAHHYRRRHDTTIIKRPGPKNSRLYSSSPWRTSAERPCRPLQTVVLGKKVQNDVLTDMNEFLAPVSAKWYAERGIPYRRGYLFSGPPGTGKTSLIVALAGTFGLGIYVVSLLDPTISEEDLSALFMGLPARCIVLLEDIDSAGLIMDDREPLTTAELDSSNDQSNLAVISKALTKVNRSEDERKNSISLSGLLNIIDGVASHEGHVLIMTTNKPESLDPALTRPGRVDHLVEFENATQQQAKELFERLYAKATKETSPGASASPLETQLMSPVTHTTAANTPFTTADETVAAPATNKITAKSVADLAIEFSQSVSDGEFSAAALQGYLLIHKRDPHEACRKVKEWVMQRRGITSS